jgi:hypothetical protein
MLEAEFARWRQTGSRRHLLTGRDLTGVLKYRDQLLAGENSGGKAEYLQACLARRRIFRLAAAAAGIGVVGLGYGSFRWVDTLQEKKALTSWGFPELFTLQNNLDALTITSPINDFGWLRSRRIRELAADFNGSSLAGLEQLKGLTTLTLHLSGSKIPNLAGLEQSKGLTTLTLHLRGSNVPNLAGLEQLKGLTTLTLDLSRSNIPNLAGLEQLKGLTTLTLHLRGSNVPNLAGLERLQRLTTLTLHLGSKIPNLAGLEQLKGLTTLTLDLRGSNIPNLAGLEQLQRLTTLTLDLRGSNIPNLAGLEQLQG